MSWWIPGLVVAGTAALGVLELASRWWIRR